VGAANLLHGTVIESLSQRCRVRLAAGATLTVAAGRAFAKGHQVIVSIRPEHLIFFTSPAEDRWPALLRTGAVVGGALREELMTDDGTELTRTSVRAPYDVQALTGPVFCGVRHDGDANLFSIN